MREKSLQRSLGLARLLHRSTARPYKLLAITVTILLMATITYWQTKNRVLVLPIQAGNGLGDVRFTKTKSMIPPKIWQIVLPMRGRRQRTLLDSGTRSEMATWPAMNDGFTYKVIDANDADDFLHSHFSHAPRIIDLYRDLYSVGMRSDLLRYLILSIEGGVYTDTDTIAIKPVEAWIPEHMRNKVRLVVGIEFDRRDGVDWTDIPHWVQICQWTIAAAPGHAAFSRMIDRILLSTEELSKAGNVPIRDLRPESFDVMNTTGPAAWTDVIFQLLKEHDSSLNTTKDLAFLTEPRLYGDILLLPIDGFGMGQLHSHSTHDGTTPPAALVQHMFRGSWRDN